MNDRSWTDAGHVTRAARRLIELVERGYANPYHVLTEIEGAIVRLRSIKRRSEALQRKRDDAGRNDSDGHVTN